MQHQARVVDLGREPVELGALGGIGVGQATRRTVIISFLVILVLGYMMTRLFYR